MAPIRFLFVIGVVVIVSFQGCSHSTTTGKTNNFKPRPTNVSAHAYLFESNQGYFMLYVWVEYTLFDAKNGIHRLRICDELGKLCEDSYYFELDPDKKSNIDEHNYMVRDALSSAVTIVSAGDSLDLYYFLYSEDANQKDSCTAGKGFSKAISLEANPHYLKNNNLMRFMHGSNFCIKLEENDGNYNVTMIDELGTIKTETYALHCQNEVAIKNGPLFKFKYYDQIGRRIYLVEKRCYLEALGAK